MLNTFMLDDEGVTKVKLICLFFPFSICVQDFGEETPALDVVKEHLRAQS